MAMQEWQLSQRHSKWWTLPVRLPICHLPFEALASLPHPHSLADPTSNNHDTHRCWQQSRSISLQPHGFEQAADLYAPKTVLMQSSAVTLGASALMRNALCLWIRGAE